MPRDSGNKARTSSSASTARGDVVPLPTSRKPRRVYKESVNKNRFGCKGHFITGPDRLYFWGAMIMILAPGIAFLAAVYVRFTPRLTLIFAVPLFLLLPSLPQPGLGVVIFRLFHRSNLRFAFAAFLPHLNLH